MVKFVEGVPVFIKAPLEQNYKITPAQLEAAITPKSKAFMFSSPCNPTGSVYSKEELKALVEVFAKHPDIIIISDEIYEYINYESKNVSIGSFAEVANRVVTINGLSKGFAMTGWRLGYLAAPKDIAMACEKIQGQFTSGTSGISQKAAVAALTGNKEPSMKMVQAFERRRLLVQTALEKIPGLKCNAPEGAFYFFPDISSFLGKKFNEKRIETATDLCLYLLHDGHVSTVTGEAFGDENCIRLSYATSDEKLIIAMERIKNALAKLC
jgi:aspartate aminotransferase